MRKLMWFAVGFAAACFPAVYLIPSAALVWAGLAAALLAALLWMPLRRRLFARAALLGLAAGLIWCWGYRALVVRPAYDSAEADVCLRAEACDYSEQKEFYTCVEAYAETGSGRVRTKLYLYGFDRELRPGDVLEGAFKLRPSDQKLDGARWYDDQARGILLIGSGKVGRVSRPDRIPFRFWPKIAARALGARLSETVPADAAGFVRAIVTGDRSGLSDPDRDALRTSGLSHVIAVSGMHVGLLLTLMILLMGRGGWLRTTVQAIVLIAFALLTGSTPSVLRACIMLLLGLYAGCFRRLYDAPTALAAAALCILLPNPWACANVSFQLSFAAVAGLILIGAPLQNRFWSFRRWRRLLQWQGPEGWPPRLRKCLSWPVRKGAAFVRSCTAATVGVLIFTVPVTALVFRSFSVYALLSNLLALPLVLPCCAGGLLCLSLGALWLPLGSLCGAVLAWPVRLILLICRLVSALPFASLRVDTPYGIGMLAAIYLLLALFWLLKQKKLRFLALQVSLCVVIACFFTGLSDRAVPFTAAALDVGQGQCVVLRCEAFCAVVDCGGTVSGGSGAYAASFLKRNGIQKINVLVLTHYDSDHINGFRALLDRVETEAVFLPDVDFDPEKRAWAEEAASSRGIPIYYVDRDMTLSFSGGRMELYAPVSAYDDNAASLSVLFSAGEYDMLITGDMDLWAEYDLLLTHDLPKLEAYVAGHHGSRHSSSPELLQTLRPQTVLISVGAGNRYGHPDPETLERFAQLGAEVLRTDLQGDILIGR